jgi:hypothetical protein
MANRTGPVERAATYWLGCTIVGGTLAGIGTAADTPAIVATGALVGLVGVAFLVQLVLRASRTLDRLNR